MQRRVGYRELTISHAPTRILASVAVSLSSCSRSDPFSNGYLPFAECKSSQKYTSKRHPRISAIFFTSMDCLVMPVSLIRRRSTGSRMGYMPLTKEQESDSPVTVVVGKEKRVFLVEPFILEENPFRVLMDISMKKDPAEKEQFHRRVIFVDVDDILFEHMLWLMHNDASSLFQLNLKEIIDFYTHDV
ncbi:hypothetical protein CR513_51351, partial [Mucuna pruriens]